MSFPHALIPFALIAGGIPSIPPGEVSSPIAGVSLDAVIDYQPEPQQAYLATRFWGTKLSVDLDSRVGAGQGAEVQAILSGRVTEVRPLAMNHEESTLSLTIESDVDGAVIKHHYSHVLRSSIVEAFGTSQNLDEILGAEVSVGQVLGAVSVDFISAQPHLGLTVQVDGDFVDPQAFLAELVAGELDDQGFIQHPPVPFLSSHAYGAPRPNGTLHSGIDVDITDGIDDQFQSYIGGVVTKGPNEYGSYGYYIDIYNADLGVVERIASAAEILVQEGDLVVPGQIVAQGETETGVIQLEYREPINSAGQGGYGFEGTRDPLAFLASQGIYLGWQ